MSVVDDPSRPQPAPSTGTQPALVEQPPRDQSPTQPATRPAARPVGGLFRAFWRWHFYAAAIVIPVLFVLAVTGLIYLFRFQIEPFLHADLMRVDHAQGQLTQPYETQLEQVTKAYADATVISVTEPGSPDATTRFTVETTAGETRDVFVDPYTTEVLGSLDPDSTISGTAVRIHADLMAGRVGDTIMELGVCWAIVMAITGYYLYFRGLKARRRQRASGTPQASLRTTHARVGAVIGGGMLLLVVSGLPWTGIWGEQVQKLATNSGTSLWGEDPGALSNPTSTLDESLPHSHHAIPWAQEKSGVPSSTPPSASPSEQVSTASVDTAVEVAHRAGLAHPFTVALPSDQAGVYSVIGYAFDDPSREQTVHIDQYGGQGVSTYGYDQYPALAKVVSQGIALHEGRRFGTFNLWLTTAFCLGVIVSCITGPLMWWRRRPRATSQIGAPRGRMPLKASPPLAVAIVALGIFLPVFGVSLLIVLLIDQFVVRRSERLMTFVGAK
ncbi:PepSY domain-containing protein [Intrasporangium mesophilum]